MFILEMCSPFISVSLQIEVAPMDDSAQSTNHSFHEESVSVDVNKNANSTSNVYIVKSVRNDTSHYITARRIRKYMYALLF